MLNFVYFQNIFGGAHCNTQVRLGIDSNGNVRTCVTVGINNDNTTYISSGVEAWLDYLSLNDIGWFGESTAENFTNVALLAGSLNIADFKKFFDDGVRLP
jgi:hypothetical protein